MSKAANTRLTILQKAFELIYKNGYQATSIDVIIAETKVTKGAFYYHFKNKEEMGLALINEVMSPGMYEAMVRPLLNAQSPLDEIYEMMQNLLLHNSFFQVKYGCPAINLIEEMSPLSESFSKALSAIVLRWQQSIETSIKKGISSDKIRMDVEPREVSCFITAGYGGIRNMGKLMGTECYHTYLKSLQYYLKSLS